MYGTPRLIVYDGLTGLLVLAKCAKVRSVFLFVVYNLVVSGAEAVGVDPLTTGSFALEHAPARTTLVRVVGTPAQAVDGLVLA